MLVFYILGQQNTSTRRIEESFPYALTQSLSRRPDFLLHKERLEKVYTQEGYYIIF